MGRGEDSQPVAAPRHLAPEDSRPDHRRMNAMDEPIAVAP